MQKNSVKQLRFIKLFFTPPVFIFTLLLLLASAARVIVITTREDTYSGDQAFFYFITRSIVVEHKIALIGSYVGNLGGFAQSAGWNYLLAIPFIFTHGSPRGEQVLMFVISLFTIVLGSFFFWRFVGKIEGVIATFLLGFSPYLIMYTNRVLPPYIIPFFTVTYVSSLILFLKTRQNKFFFFMTLSIVCMFLVELSAFGLLIPSYLLLTVYLLHEKTLHWKIFLKNILFLILFFIPHLLYDFSHNFYNTKGVLAMLPLHKTSLISSHFPSNFADRFHLFKTDIIYVFPTVQTKIVLSFFCVLLIGACLLLFDKNTEKWKKLFIGYTVLTIFLTFALLLIVPTKHADVWWLTILTIFYIFLAVIVCGYFVRKKNILFIFLVICFFSLFTKSAIDNFSLLLEQKNVNETNTFPIKFQEPIEYIYHESHNKPFTVIYITASPNTLDFKYLFWYIGTTQYPRSKALNTLDLNYTTTGGYRYPIHVKEQFNHLKKGLYYIIITKETMKSGYAASLLKKIPNQDIKSSKKFDDNFIVKKAIIT